MSLIDTDHGHKNITNNINLTCWAPFAFMIGLVTVGTMMPHAHAQPDLYQRATLEPAYDDQFTNDIQHILDNYHWTRNYEYHNFSCTDISIYMMMLFESYGFTTVCITDSQNGKSLNGDDEGHMWIAVEDPRHKEAWIFIDGDDGLPNKQPLSDSIGQIVYGSQYQTGYITSDPIGYLMKYDSPRQPWRQHYSLDDITHHNRI